MTKLEAPERVWLWRDDPSGNLVASGPDEPYPAGSKAYVPEKAIDTAREEGRRAGLEEAAKYHIRFLMERTSVPVEKVVASTEAIRDLIGKPADPVAEAAILLADHIDRDMNAANRMIEAYTKVTMDTPVRHWLSQCLRALAQKEGK